MASRLLDYLRLLRLPNVFTAMADVAMGFLFVHGSFEPRWVLVCLLIASSALYSAGMVLNDLYDVEVDRQERPRRPLPSGRIPIPVARNLGYGLLVLGLAMGWLAGWIQPPDWAMPWRAGVVAMLIAASVLLYDRLLKATPVGPLAMGMCRFWNVLLGMSAAGPAGVEGGVLGFTAPQWLAAAGIGTYITGVTWFSRTEARRSNRGMLAAAAGVMIVGFVLLANLARVAPVPLHPVLTRPAWVLLLALLAVPILRRAATAVADPIPARVQGAVKLCILSLILIDAAVSLLSAPFACALAIVLLLAPSLLLGRWVYST